MEPSSAWLSLSEAAQVLGVHFTTLRRWADQGHIEYMRTPGGKRRFHRKAIEDFLNHRRENVETLPGLVQVKDTAIIRAQRELRSHGLTSEAWYLHLNENQRLDMRSAGRNLIALLLQFCSRETGSEVFLEEGKRLAQGYGQFCRSSGLTMTQCIGTFLFFRRSMVSAIHETGSLRGMGDTESLRLLDKMNVFFDETMIAMVGEYIQS